MKKRLCSLFLAAITLLPIAAFAANDEQPTSGECGDGVIWNYEPEPNEYGNDTGGTLTISYTGTGTGKMTDYDSLNPPWNWKIKSVVIEDGVTSIGECAFSKYNNNLSSIIIPDSVTSIGTSAFFSCNNLSNITIPNSVTSIGESAFSNCGNLSSIIIPGSVDTIQPYTFSSCDNLTDVTISNGVCIIEKGAFSDCSSLRSIYIPPSIIRFAYGNYFAFTSFDGCTNLAAIDIDPQNIEFSSVNGVVYNKEKSELYMCPEGASTVEIPSNVSKIGSYAFQSCRKIDNILIPSSITNIGNNAFTNCSGLTSITIPNSVTDIGYETFSNCTALTNVTLSNNITGYFSYRRTFMGCISLTTITVPEGVTHLSETFSGCTNLTSISLPVSLKHIESDTFKNCTKLASITYAGTDTQWALVDIADGNPEIGLAVLTCTGSGSTTPDNPSPDNPDPIDPDTLPLTTSDGGLGTRVSLRIEGGHWLTIQVRRAGSIAITSVQAPGSGQVTMSFSAPVGSRLQVWETEDEMTFTNGVPNNPILATAVRTL